MSSHFEMAFSKNRFKVGISASPAQAVASLPIFWNAPLVVQFFNVHFNYYFASLIAMRSKIYIFQHSF
jgi:hypothetical protein